MSKFAWVTLTTNDTYSLGALVLAHSLKRAGTAHQLAVLVTPTVSEAMRDRLKDVYNVVQEVNVLDSQDAANLALLSRPELGVTFTKLHCWRLVQFEKCVFLDADTLVLKNCDELFEREELSAAPDVSWPDCFNSGVFVFTPNVDTFNKITEYAVQHGSFDGGDQGLLNQYFGDWSTADIKKHLPFVYNVTAYASYCYLPAFKQFRDKIKILHFAGKLKPWLIQFNSETKTAATPSDYAHAQDLIQQWWTIFCDNVHQNLSDNMCLCLNITHSLGYTQYHEYDVDSYYHQQQQQQVQQQQVQQQQQQQQQGQYVPHVREFRDPWTDYYEQQTVPQTESMQAEFEHDENSNNETSYETQVHDGRTTTTTTATATTESQSRCDSPQLTDSMILPSPIPSPIPMPTPSQVSTASSMRSNEAFISIDVNSNANQSEQPQVHLPPTTHRQEQQQQQQQQQQHAVHCQTVQQTIQTTIHHQQHNHLEHYQHPHPHHHQDHEQKQQQLHQHSQVEDAAHSDRIEMHEAGLAGALSQLRIGAQRTPEQEHYENLMRRQCWEAGQIDYAGADSFDNIWKKITQTLEAKPEQGAAADQTDKARANVNRLGTNQLLTKTANDLLLTKLTRPKPTSKANHSLLPSSSSNSSSSSGSSRAAADKGSNVTEVKASSTPATINKTPTNAQRTIPDSDSDNISNSEAVSVSVSSDEQLPTPMPRMKPQQQQQERLLSAAQQQQHIKQPSPSGGAPNRPSRQKVLQLLTSTDIEDGKIEYDKATGASTQYKVIEGGYEMITTSPQPNGTIKTQVRTFWDPKPVSDEDLVKEQANKKLVKQRLGKEIRIDDKTTMLTRAIEGGYEEVYTTVNADGSRSMRTKTFFDSVPTEINENTNTQVNKLKKNVTRKSSVDSTDSTESTSRRVVQKVSKNVSKNVNDQQSNYREDTTFEETRSVSQNIEITENNRTVRKNSLQEQSIKAITQSTSDGGKKKKKTKSSAPPPPADFQQNDTTTVASKRVPGGVEYTYSTELESGKTITTSKTVYEEEEVELTEEEIRQYKKTLKDAEKHKNVTTTKKLKSESGTKKIVPSENPGDVTTVETIKIEGGTEYHYTTVTSEGIVKKAVKTVYDPVPTSKSNPDDTDEEEIIEEYEEEIIEPGEKTVKTIETVKHLPTKFEEEVTITHEKKEKKVKKSMVISQ